MKFEFDLENVILQDRLIIMEIAEIVDRQIEMLSETSKDQLAWELSNVRQACLKLDYSWLHKRESEISQALNEQYFEPVEELDEKKSS